MFCVLSCKRTSVEWTGYTKLPLLGGEEWEMKDILEFPECWQCEHCGKILEELCFSSLLSLTATIDLVSDGSCHED